MSKIRFASEEYVNKVMPAAPNWGAAVGEPGYIENRTHWVEPAKELLLSETTDKFMSDLYYIDLWEGENSTVSTLPSLFEGANYVVTINNVSYNVVCWSYTNEVAETTRWLGDSRKLEEAYGDEDAMAIAIKDLNPIDVPFLISQEDYLESDANGPGEAATWRNSIVIYTNNDSDLVKIEKLTAELEYHTLDKNYLPMDDIYEGIMSRMAIAEEASF